jgi:hypothetical protein
MPGAAWVHVFPAGCELPELRVFVACVEDATGAQPGCVPFDASGIARLVDCCPALVDVEFATSADASLAPLQSLTALTRLDIGPISLASVSFALAGLSQLHSLHLSVAVPHAPVGGTPPVLQHLVPLTALTSLTSLHCAWRVGSEEEGYASLPGCWFGVSNKVGTVLAVAGSAGLLRGACCKHHSAVCSLHALCSEARSVTDPLKVLPSLLAACRPLPTCPLTSGCSWWRSAQTIRQPAVIS